MHIIVICMWLKLCAPGSREVWQALDLKGMVVLLAQESGGVAVGGGDAGKPAGQRESQDS